MWTSWTWDGWECGWDMLRPVTLCDSVRCQLPVGTTGTTDRGDCSLQATKSWSVPLMFRRWDVTELTELCFGCDKEEINVSYVWKKDERRWEKMNTGPKQRHIVRHGQPPHESFQKHHINFAPNQHINWMMWCFLVYFYSFQWGENNEKRQLKNVEWK